MSAHTNRPPGQEVVSYIPHLVAIVLAGVLTWAVERLPSIVESMIEGGVYIIAYYLPVVLVLCPLVVWAFLRGCDAQSPRKRYNISLACALLFAATYPLAYGPVLGLFR